MAIGFAIAGCDAPPLTATCEEGAAPTNLAATASSSGVELRWDSGADDSYFFIVSMRREEESTWGEVTRSVGGEARSFVHTNPPRATGVVYQVSAHRDTCDTAWSNEAPTLTLPEAPVLTCAAPGTQALQASWIDANIAVTSYRLERRDVPAADFSVIATLPNTASTYDDTVLAAATSYEYRVSAINDAGEATSNLVTCWTLPNAPQALTVEAVVVGEMWLSWADTNNGGTYVVQRSDPAGWTTLTSSAETSFDDVTCPPATELLYRVYGVGPWSEAAAQLTSAAEGSEWSLPQAPSDLTVTTVGPYSLQVRFTDPNPLGTSYDVLRDDGGGMVFAIRTSAFPLVDDGLVNGEAEGLDPGTAYAYRLFAVEPGGGWPAAVAEDLAATEGIGRTSALPGLELEDAELDGNCRLTISGTATFDEDVEPDAEYVNASAEVDVPASGWCQGPEADAASVGCGNVTQEGSGELTWSVTDTYGGIGTASRTVAIEPTPVPALMSLPGSPGLAPAPGMQLLDPAQVAGCGPSCGPPEGRASLGLSNTHSCVVEGSAGGVACWGVNTSGELGTGSTSAESRRPVPVCASGSGPGCTGGTALVGARAVTSSHYNSCALMEEGAVKCWGSNTNNGNGHDVYTGAALNPVDVCASGSGPGCVGGSPLPGATALAAGVSHTCALLDDSTVRCWGDYSDGKLGAGDTSDYDYPTVPVCASGNYPESCVMLTGVAGIAAGGSHTCALLSGGEVWCWGSNNFGQLGDGTTGVRLNPVLALGGAAAVAAGVNHTCALMTGGSVKCWGHAHLGQVGDGTLGDVDSRRLTPVDVCATGKGCSSAGVFTGAVAIAAGIYHTCAIVQQGGVMCWGATSLVGDGTGPGFVSNPVETCADGAGPGCPGGTVGPLRGALAIEAGDSHTCALLQGGALMCWGYNGGGVLGGWCRMASDLSVGGQHRGDSRRALRAADTQVGGHPGAQQEPWWWALAEGALARAACLVGDATVGWPPACCESGSSNPAGTIMLNA